jgi:2,4-dienoyl-CoA reductase-like NADH-dependent reductase (Old Yellow Enzyme family)
LPDFTGGSGPEASALCLASFCPIIDDPVIATVELESSMFTALFSPFEVGPISLTNRIVVAPMCQYSASDGSATDWHLQHWSQLGYSGAGLIIIEATAVERRGRITHGCLGLYSDEDEASLARVLTAARRIAGPAKFGIQLAHAGRKASVHLPWDGGDSLKPNEDPWLTIAPSAIPFKDWHVPHALSIDEIKATTAQFVQAAQRALRLGLDVIELHSAHGYLIHQFLSPLSNHRTDQYGGSLENRMRFGLETLAALRAVIPANKALGMRISATDWVDGGWTLQDSIEYVRAAQRIGIDYICASSGGLVHDVKIPTTPGYQVSFAEAIRKATGVTTRAVGLITGAQQADDILTSGKADLIALARAILDDPRWGWHAADALGAKVYCPPQYERSRNAHWVQTKEKVEHES